MHSYVLRRSWLIPLCLLVACPEKEEVPEIPHEAVPVGPVEVAPPVDPGADRLKNAEVAKQRMEALEKALDPKLTADALLESADAAYQQQHFKEARDAYRALVLLHTQHEKAPQSVNLAVLSSFRLGEYDDGLQFFEDALHLFDGTSAEPRLLRVLGNTYLAIPHWGIKKGGELIRGRWDQGIYQDTHRLDRSLAIQRMEEARTIYLEAQHAALVKERIEATFDLIAAHARFTPYDRSWYYWYYAWPEAQQDELVDAEGADEHADEWADRSMLYRAEPRGLPVDPEGNPIFDAKPDTYGGSTVQKMKFLLHEIGQIDPSPNKQQAADALLRQAMLFATRDGPDRLQRFAGWWWNGTHPYKAAVEEK